MSNKHIGQTAILGYLIAAISFYISESAGSGIFEAIGSLSMITGFCFALWGSFRLSRM